MSKRIVILSLVIIAFAFAGAYWWVQSKNTMKISLKGCSFGEYKVQSTSNTGFCGNDEVLDGNNKHIVTLRLCEDNICTIEKKGDWVVISTTAGRIFKKNVLTGEEILNAEGGVGGMSVAK